MEIKSSVKKNIIFNSILTLSSFIFPLITFPYTSRVLLPLGTGKVSLATSFVSYFVLFSQLGIPTYGIRECAKVRDNKYELSKVVHELLFINMVMAVFMYLILIVCILTIPSVYKEKRLYLILSINVLLTALGIEWLYRGLEKYEYITKRSILFKLVSLALMFFLVKSQDDYVIYGAISIFASSASYLLNFINSRRYIYWKPLKEIELKRHIKPILFFFSMTIAASIYTNLDTIMLGFLKGEVEVGYYHAAIKVKLILVSLVTSLGSVLLPRSSYYIEKGLMKEFQFLIRKSINFIVLFAIPISIFFIIFSKECILFLAGPEYYGSILSMRIILPCVFFIGMSNTMGIQMLIPQGKEGIVLKSTILGSIVDVIINAILIPRYGSSGAAVGTLVAEYAVVMVQYFALRNDLAEIIKRIHYFRIIEALALGIIPSLWIKTLALGNFLTLAISAVLFFGIYGLYLLWRKEEMILEIWNMVVGTYRCHFFGQHNSCPDNKRK